MKYKYFFLAVVIATLGMVSCDSGGSSSSYDYSEPTTKEVTCSNCNGSGRLMCSQCSGSGAVFFYGNMVACPGCGGYGKFVCNSCNGTGSVTVSSGSSSISFKGGGTGDPCHYPIGASTCSGLNKCSGFKEGSNFATCGRCGHARSKHY